MDPQSLSRTTVRKKWNQFYRHTSAVHELTHFMVAFLLLYSDNSNNDHYNYMQNKWKEWTLMYTVNMGDEGFMLFLDTERAIS